MDFVETVGDTTNLPVFFVGGVARAEILDNCMVRITMLRVSDPGADAMPIPECQFVMSIRAWCLVRAAMAQLADAIAKLGLNLSGETGHRVANNMNRPNHH